MASSQLVDLATIGAVNFKDLFYLSYDSQRQVMPQFYRDRVSTVVWNGNPCPTIAKCVVEFVHSLQ